MATFEGRIRDLALTDVVQLLGRGRKSGWLHCEAPLLDRAVAMRFVGGGLAAARAGGIGDILDRAVPWSTDADEAVLEALCWRDGHFRFTPDDAADDTAIAGAATRAVDPLLMEAAQRAATWSRLEPHVPHARVVPAFRALEPGELPPLRLSPVQWDVLAHVDGSRDLVALAEAMQRDLVEVAEEVHGLIVCGLLTVREAPVAPRRNPTPPVVGAVPEPVADERDLWIPDPFLAAATGMPGNAHTDAIFDPIEVGVLTPEGLPRVATPRATPVVALRESGPSFQEEAQASPSYDDAASLAARATALATSGRLAEAVAWWQAALRHPMADAEAAQVREAIALASRLHVLLHP